MQPARAAPTRSLPHPAASPRIRCQRSRPPAAPRPQRPPTRAARPELLHHLGEGRAEAMGRGQSAPFPIVGTPTPSRLRSHGSSHRCVATHRVVLLLQLLAVLDARLDHAKKRVQRLASANKMCGRPPAFAPLWITSTPRPSGSLHRSHRSRNLSVYSAASAQVKLLSLGAYWCLARRMPRPAVRLQDTRGLHKHRFRKLEQDNVLVAHLLHATPLLPCPAAGRTRTRRARAHIRNICSHLPQLDRLLKRLDAPHSIPSSLSFSLPSAAANRSRTSLTSTPPTRSSLPWVAFAAIAIRDTCSINPEILEATLLAHKLILPRRRPMLAIACMCPHRRTTRRNPSPMGCGVVGAAMAPLLHSRPVASVA